MIVSADFETRSPVDIRKHGAFVYFQHPETKVLMCGYRIDAGALKLWTYDQPMPADLADAIRSGATIRAWNAQFETLGFNLLADRHNWPRPRPEQFVCTAATAAAMALPRSLDDAGSALGLAVQKDKDGTRLIRKFSIPRRAKKDEPPGLYWNEPEDHPEDFAAFGRYCLRDVETEEEAARRLVPLSDYEQDLWLIDQRINARGIRIDRRSARAALVIAEKAKALLDREMKICTSGYVPATTQPGKLVEWVQNQGITMGSAAKAEIEELLEADDLPANVRRAVEIRQEAAKTSVSKVDAFLKRTSDDGRIRGAFLFSAAGTGRWSSVGAQLHNLPRPRRIYGDIHPRLDVLFDAFRLGDPEALRLLYPEEPKPVEPEAAKFLYPDSGGTLGRPLHLISDALRSFIWAGPGNDLVVADYSGIEGAVAAWFADEDWKLAAMRDIIADPTLPDLYRLAASGIFNTTTEIITKKDTRRQVGKVAELSLQYQGGPGAFRSMARNYSMKLAPLFPIVWAVAGEDRRTAALKRFANACARNEPVTKLMTREEFIAAEIVKLGWRTTHPAISSCWPLLEDAARQAVETPGVSVRAKKVDYLVARGFLWCKLPSGRCLAYGTPRIKEQVWVKPKLEDGSWSDVSEVIGRAEAHVLATRGDVKIEREAKSAVTALGVNSTTKKWERFGLYGGLAFENIVQAIARDLLANGIKKSEAAGYPVIGHVHDEIIAEVPRGWGDVKAFETLICGLPEWAAGLPLVASGFRAKRYKKD